MRCRKLCGFQMKCKRLTTNTAPHMKQLTSIIYHDRVTDQAWILRLWRWNYGHFGNQQEGDSGNTGRFEANRTGNKNCTIQYEQFCQLANTQKINRQIKHVVPMKISLWTEVCELRKLKTIITTTNRQEGTVLRGRVVYGDWMLVQNRLNHYIHVTVRIRQ